MNLRKAFAAAVCAAMVTGAAVVPSFAQDNKLPAFPGVEGGGKYTMGARANDTVEVYHVTNLNDDGDGSLRDAISKSGRIVVFDVGGIIELKSRLDFTQPNITVLGQTAPGDGITITNYDSVIKADNIIIRYLRIRPTDSQGGEPDGLGGRWVHNIVLDHCSVSWGVDEMLTLYSGSLESREDVSQNVTVQYCLSSESLRMSSHIKGAHGYGGIVGGTDATWHHNLWANHDSRNPRFDRNLKNTDVVNNVIYNFGNNIMYGAEPYSYGKKEDFSKPEYVSNINIRNNYIKSGPSTKPEIRSKIFEATNDGSVTYNGEPLKSNAYISGNYVYGNEAATKNNTASEEQVVNMGMLNILSEPVDMNGYDIDMQTAEQAYETVMENVGATLPRRDAIDARVIADVKNGTGRIINQEEEVGGFVSIDRAERVFEIPSDWKAEHGMGDAKESDIAPSGYTWIEEYVNEWTAAQEKPTNPEIQVISPATASTDKTMDKTGGKGFWLVTDKAFEYEAKADAGTEKIEIYDRTDKLYAAEGSEVKTKLELNKGTHYITALAYNGKGEKTTSDTAIVYVTGGDAITEIGSVAYEGKSRAWVADGRRYIAGSGKIGGTSDSFSFDYEKKNGDFIYTVRIDEIPKYENGPLAGIMVRDGLDADARMVMLSDTWKKYGENIIVPVRKEKGAELETLYLTKEDGSEVSNESSYDTEKYPMPRYMRIERKGNELILSVSDSGLNWTDNVRRPMRIDISGWSDELCVGLAVDSQNELSKEASPMLPWFTIAAFTRMRDVPVTVTAQYDGAGALIGTVTSDTPPENTEGKKIFVF